MALTKSQEQAVIRLFALAFKSCDNIKKQKKMYLQFENEFGKGINDWKEKCRNALQEQSSDEEIIDFYQKLFTQVNKKSFVLLYLDSENVESNIRAIMEERVDEQGNPMWYQMMLNYLKESPYGKTHGCESFTHLIKHLEHRQQLEKRIVNEVLKDNAIVLPSKNWEGRLHFEDFA